MPLRDHLVHSFVQNKETEAQMGQVQQLNYSYAFFTISLGSLVPLVGSLACITVFQYLSQDEILKTEEVLM